MDRLEFLERQCKRFEERVRTKVKNSEDVRRLMSAKGLVSTSQLQPLRTSEMLIAFRMMTI